MLSVHTGNNYVSPSAASGATAATLPSKCIPPPRGTTCAALSGHPLPRRLAGHVLCLPACLHFRGRPPASLSACPSSTTTSVTLRHVLQLLWPRPGLPPQRHWVRSSFSSCHCTTFQRRLPLLGPPGGFQVATKASASPCPRRSFPHPQRVAPRVFLERDHWMVRALFVRPQGPFGRIPLHFRLSVRGTSSPFFLDSVFGFILCGFFLCPLLWCAGAVLLLVPGVLPFSLVGFPPFRKDDPSAPRSTLTGQRGESPRGQFQVLSISDECLLDWEFHLPRMSRQLDARSATFFRWAGGQTGQEPHIGPSVTRTSSTRDLPQVVWCKAHTSQRGGVQEGPPHRLVTVALTPAQ